MKRGLLSLAIGCLAIVFWASAPTTATAQDPQRMYHYPYYYFPQSYYPNTSRWPDARKPFQPAPFWMSYPPYLDQQFTYPLFESKRYYRGHHFFLDQF